MSKITQDFYQTKRKRASYALFGLSALLLMGTQMSWGQSKQLTGQFSGTDGGFEGQAVTGSLLAVTSNVADAVKWNSGSSSFQATVINNSTAASRSGENSLSCNVTSGTKYLISPKLVPTLTANADYVVQFYYKSGGVSAPALIQSALAPSASPAGSTTTYLPATYASNVWIKAYRVFPAVASPTSANFAGIKASGAASPNNLLMVLDDFVIYQGSAIDNTVPEAPTLPVVSGLDVNWTASSDVDGGGYLVVRYATNPNADNDPNVNGIYAIGNTITNGTGSLVGTVVYTGTATSFTDGVAGSVSGSDYYKIYSVDKAFNYSDEITGTATAGATTTTWNGSAWSNSAPDSTVEAIIDGAYSTTTDGAFTAKKLTVNATKSLTINSTTNVTVQNEVINNGSLVVENNANLIQVNNTTNTGNVVVNRNSNDLLRLDYTMWSSPVASQNLATFSPLTSLSPSRFYTYDSTAGTSGLYSAIADPTTTNFSAGTGYLIRMPNDASAVTPTAYPGVFTGVPNNGNVSLAGLTSGLYYAVGNPYPSTISAESFLAGNSTDGILYFWRKTNAALGSAYATYTLGGATTTTPTSAAPNGTIQVGQGFIVKTTAATLDFANTMRAGSLSTQFFKTKQVVERNRVWLNLTSATGVFSQALVAYMTDATQGVDAGIDGEYINDSPVALTSNINDKDYTIQGRALPFDPSDVVALNFKTDVVGDYTIAIDHADGLFATGQDVYLVDNTTGKETNLKTDAYTFTATAGADNARFALKYQKTLKIDAPAFNDNSVTVYKNKGTLYINSGTSAINNVKVFDIQGRLIAEQKNVKANSIAVKDLKATQQVLIIKVTSEDNKVVNKKVAN